MLKRPEAAAALKDFVVAVLYTDKHTEYRKVMNKRFKEIALPLYIVVGPDGVERSRLAGQINLDEFLSFLKKGANPTVGKVHSTLEPALAEARSNGKPLFVEFSGFTKPKNLVMKERILKRPEVREVLKNFVLAELFVDGRESKENLALMRERFRAVAPPVYVTMAPDGTVRSRLDGMASETEFLAFLERGIGVSSK